VAAHKRRKLLTKSVIFRIVPGSEFRTVNARSLAGPAPPPPPIGPGPILLDPGPYIVDTDGSDCKLNTETQVMLNGEDATHTQIVWLAFLPRQLKIMLDLT
jgi:hypothetical protein